MGKKLKTTQHLYPTDMTDTGATKLREYEAIKTCKHCGNKFVINQLKTGREPIYCTDKCRYAASFKRRNPKGLKNGYISHLEANLHTDDEALEKIIQKVVDKTMKKVDDQKNVTGVELPAKTQKLPAKRKKGAGAKQFGANVGASALGSLAGTLLANWSIEKFTKEGKKPLTSDEFVENNKRLREAIIVIVKYLSNINNRLEASIKNNEKKEIPTFF